MKVVLDTNIWLDWLVYNDACVLPLRALVEQGVPTLLASPLTRAELEAVLQRPLIRDRLPGEPAQALALYDTLVRLVDEPARCDLSCRDPDDQVFIDLAVAHGADWLLTKDKALLALAGQALRRFEVRVVRPEGMVVRE